MNQFVLDNWNTTNKKVPCGVYKAGIRYCYLENTDWIDENREKKSKKVDTLE